ncbi:hypothetical protein XENOCAPTIV_007457, partial [Xenoophorus captivus]
SGLFHPSWLLCVYQRMFHSENKSLMREGVCHLLELQVLQQQDFAVPFSQVDIVFDACKIVFGCIILSKEADSICALRFREVLRCTMITHQVLLRGAAQCFLLNSALRLTDVSQFSWHTGQAERLPDSREADKLARAILLCVDMERRQTGEKTSETLRSLLSPLLDTLSRVYTNIYLPVRKSDKKDDVIFAIERAFLKLVDPVQDFILRRLCGELQEVIRRRHSPSLSNYKEPPLVTNSDVCICFFLWQLFDIERAELYLSVLRQLVVMCSSLSGCSKNIQQYAFPKLIKYSLSCLLEPTHQDWGRIAANFLRDQWICLNFLIRTVGIPEFVETSKVSETLGAALSHSVEALSLLPSDLVLPVLNFMNTTLPQDSLISKSKVRYYSNSLQHRVKNRAWQTLLLLLPKLREDHEKTKTSICTFLSVLVHFSIIIPHVENKVGQLRKALDIILQSCFNHNFSVRLYALLALKRVWSLTEGLTVEEEEAEAFRGLSSVVTACEQDKEERWTEVQKKITPWRLGIHEQEPELKLVPAQRAARLGKQHGTLLVVASLIDKPTNLGGVKPVELTDFLQLKKSEGYCILVNDSMDDLDGFRSPLQAAWINASRTEGGLAKQTRLFLEALLVVMCLGAVIGKVLTCGKLT